MDEEDEKKTNNLGWKIIAIVLFVILIVTNVVQFTTKR